MNSTKKIYVIDRNGRMHLIEFTPDLTINGTLTDPDHAVTHLESLFQSRSDITFKTNNFVKVFDSKKLIGYQIVPIHE